MVARTCPSSIRQYQGDSRGHWQAGTLVVETTNFLRETSFRGSSANLLLTERFTRIDADTLMYEFTVYDPQTWTKPWSAAVPMRKMNEPVYEYACHEGNYAMRNILSGARADAENIRAFGDRRLALSSGQPASGRTRSFPPLAPVAWARCIARGTRSWRVTSR
jgi:hypothetical protein